MSSARASRQRHLHSSEGRAPASPPIGPWTVRPKAPLNPRAPPQPIGRPTPNTICNSPIRSTIALPSSPPVLRASLCLNSINYNSRKWRASPSERLISRRLPRAEFRRMNNNQGLLCEKIVVQLHQFRNQQAVGRYLKFQRQQFIGDPSR